jgi:hypothetical protein
MLDITVLAFPHDVEAFGEIDSKIRYGLKKGLERKVSLGKFRLLPNLPNDDASAGADDNEFDVGCGDKVPFINLNLYERKGSDSKKPSFSSSNLTSFLSSSLRNLSLLRPSASYSSSLSSAASSSSSSSILASSYDLFETWKISYQSSDSAKFYRGEEKIAVLRKQVQDSLMHILSISMEQSLDSGIFGKTQLCCDKRMYQFEITRQ